MNTIHIIPAGSSHWSDWLDGTPHDFYHSAAYHQFSQDQGEGQAYLAVYGSRDRYLAWPYLLREISPALRFGQVGCTDIGSVYGYAGPVCRGCGPGDTFLETAMREIEEAWRQQRAVSAFSRLHPLLENHYWIGETSSMVSHGNTVAIDLSLSPEEVLRNYNRKLRQELRYSREAGVETFIDSEWRHCDDFMRLYHHTMGRNQADSLYYFSEDYIRRLKQAMGSHAVLMIATLGGKVIAACIFMEYGDYIQAHLEGADQNYLSASPFKLMVDDERVRGQASGHRLLHLGGGLGGREDALFTVKRRFSPLRHPFFTYRKVIQHTDYEDLLQYRQTQAERDGLVFQPNGFFPAYRAPQLETHCITGGER